MESIKNKQNKILGILSLFSDKKLEKITEDNFSFDKLGKRDMAIFMECVWVDLGKEQATNKELGIGMRNVLTLSILELFKRKGLVRINKDGMFDKTKLGKEVMKELEKKK